MIHLQGIGKAQSIKASELQTGMLITWNYGSTYEVVDIQPKGKQSLVVSQKELNGNKVYQQTMRTSKDVCAYFPTQGQ